MPETQTQTHFHLIAVSPNAYGCGDTKEEAKKRLKEAGGTLTRHLIYKLPDASVNPYVNDFGEICWSWPEDYMGDRQELGKVISRRGLR